MARSNLVSVAFVAAWVAGCSKGPPAEEMLAKREQAAAYFEEKRFDKAQKTLEWILEQDSAEAQDFANMACVALENIERFDVPRSYLERARALDPKLPVVPYCLGWMAAQDGDDDEALAEFARAVELAPDDVPARYHYGVALSKVGREGEARAVFQSLLDLGVENTGSFHLSALQRFGMLLRKSPGEGEEGIRLLAQATLLRDQGLPEPKGHDLRRGYLARVRPPKRPSIEDSLTREATPITFERVEDVRTGVGAARDLTVADVDTDGQMDVITAGDQGVFLARQGGNGALITDRISTATGVDQILVGDLANEGRASVLMVGAPGLVLLAPGSGFTPTDLPIASARAAVFVDYDHEGDLDLALATAEGLRLLRNDGLADETISGMPERIVWTDVTEGAGLPAGRFDWLLIEDFDFDQDIDILAGGDATGTVMVSNLRAGHFETVGKDATGIDRSDRPAARDVNHDGHVDLVYPDRVLRNEGGMHFAASHAPLPGIAPSMALDVDLDGAVDLAWRGADGKLAVRRGSLLVDGGSTESVGVDVGEVWRLADFDGDGDADLISATDDGLTVWRSAVSPRHRAVRVALTGVRDNKGAVGAVVELRSGTRYERQLCHGAPIAFGIGADQTPPDVVRVLWANGVIQYAIHPTLDGPVEVEQKEGLEGSCPFLYTFDGERYHFISDILGITPLGLPMEEGVFVPPDHDELVRIPGDKLRPIDGEYRMQITEELREVTYLDRAALWVVDHDADVEVHPEERFTFPPFPPLRIHAMRDIHPIERATDGAGLDWTQELAEDDGDHAVPFEPLPTQFLGLATPHDIELVLPSAARDAEQVRLLMTGWLYWTNASVNIAAGHHPRHAFVPPTILVPDERGEFRPTGPPIGFPAGKTKTMVIDVTSLLNRDDLRLRVHSSIRLYWDSIRVALDTGDAPVTVTRLDPKSASLYERGFSRPFAASRPNQPERFVFEELRTRAPWNQHRGMLTRHGDVLELILDIDDRYCLFAAGDAIDLRFDAAGIDEPRPGRSRTFLLFVDGWAKDDDPNTAEGGKVEPLPFHGMSAYPYREDESYPDDPAHAEYLRSWNTRPGRNLIPSLTPDAPGDP